MISNYKYVNKDLIINEYKQKGDDIDDFWNELQDKSLFLSA